MTTAIVFHGTCDIITEFDVRYSGDTTANNDHDCFYFSDNKEVADDYGRQSFIRRYQDCSAEELVNYHEFNEDEAMITAEDIESVAEDQIKTVKVNLSFNNAYIMDLEGETIDCVRIQEIIGHLKGVSFDDEMQELLMDLIECSCTEDEIENQGCQCELPEFDALIIKNCIDDIGDESRQIQDEYVAFYSHQITILN